MKPTTVVILIIEIEATHQLRFTTGELAGLIWKFSYDRVRLGRTKYNHPNQLFLSEVAVKVGRNLSIVKDEKGYRIETLGHGMRPMVRGVSVGKEGMSLLDGDLIRLGDIEFAFERISTATSNDESPQPK